MIITPVPRISVVPPNRKYYRKVDAIIIYEDVEKRIAEKIDIKTEWLKDGAIIYHERFLYVVLARPRNYLELRSYVGEGIKRAKGKAKRIGIFIPSLGEDTVYHSITAAGLAGYTFNHYKSEKNDSVDEIFLFYKNKYDKKKYEKAISVLKGVYVARDIGNMPPQDMNPLKMEEYLQKLVKMLPNVKMEVLDERRLKEAGFNGILSVGKGSDVPPRLFVIEYRGGGKDTIALVGKAVTFDAGGLDLKSREGMDEMKYDKCGGGVVLGTLVALSLMGAKVNLKVYIPAVENLPGPRAYKPRDVIRMYNGKTVEVTNTDAEGRLILADAIAYAAEGRETKTIIDAATLTGAVVIALGNKAAGVFGTDEKMIEKIMKIGEKVGERYWKLPLYNDFLDDMKSDVADLVNSGGREGGASLAAIFLKEFTREKPWIHLDIAGVAWVQKKGPKSPMYPRGATGYGVETLALLLSKTLL